MHWPAGRSRRKALASLSLSRDRLVTWRWQRSQPRTPSSPRRSPQSCSQRTAMGTFLRCSVMHPESSRGRASIPNCNRWRRRSAFGDGLPLWGLSRSQHPEEFAEKTSDPGRLRIFAEKYAHRCLTARGIVGHTAGPHGSFRGEVGVFSVRATPAHFGFSGV